jgi:hypothetical protein
VKITLESFLNEQLDEMKQKYYIYTLSDPITGDVRYVGKTNNIKNRFWKHTGPYYLKAGWIPKNKWILWLKNQGLKPVIEILDEGTEDNIDDLERYWIEQFKQWGYKLKNVSTGGPTPSYWKGKKLSPEHVLKKVMNDPRRRDICEYEIGTDKLLAEYINVAEAHRKTGHKPETISNSCKGKTIPGKYGVYWRYKDNYFPYVKRDLKQSEESKLKSKMNNPLRKYICQYQIGTDKLIKIWNSSREIEKEIKFNHAHINKCCKGIENYNSVGGYYWRYEDNYFPYEKPSNNPIKIEQYDKNWNLIKIYNSTYELRKELKIDTRSIIKHDYSYLGYNWKIIK